MFDVVAPIQPFLGSVSRGLDSLTSDSSVSRLLNLEQTFGNTGLDSTYSPWDSFDHFGRQQIREDISSCLRISTGAGTSQQGSSKSPQVVRMSPGKTATQRSVLESEEASTSKASSSSGNSFKLYFSYIYIQREESIHPLGLSISTSISSFSSSDNSLCLIAPMSNRCLANIS